MATADNIQIYIDGVAVDPGHRRRTGQQLCALVEPNADHIWLDLDDAQDHPVAADETVRLENGMRFYTDRARTIVIDKVEYEVRSGFLTEQQLRELPEPPIPATHGIWKDVLDGLDDRIQPGEFVAIVDGDRFFTAELKVRDITITINRQPVVLHGRRHTGQEIKDAAIAQGVAIGADFLLSRKTDKKYKPVGDDEQIRVEPGDEFRALDGDDNS